MRYVDGFVLPVPKRKLREYAVLARKAGKIWLEHGALEYVECAGDDISPKGPSAFTRVARARKGDTVVFAWVVYRSRAHRDRVIARVMKDPRIEAMSPASQAIVDMRRIAYGGFKSLVELRPKSKKKTKGK